MLYVFVNEVGFKLSLLFVSGSVSNPGFPKPETRFFGYFLLPETRGFSTTKPGYFKKHWIAAAFKY